MNLLEYEAKQILKKHSIPVPHGQVIHANTPLLPTAPTVLKSQVPTGGRGKLGGIRIVDTTGELDTVLSGLFTHSIKGLLPTVVLAEEKLSIKEEFYLSLVIDKLSSSIQLVAHRRGGVEVEENNPSEFFKSPILNNFEFLGEQLAELYDTPEQTFVLQELLRNLYTCFTQNDATLIEINPLFLTKDEVFVAGDCKMTLDNAATFRHPEWSFENKENEANFVTLNQWGNVATIANGAGLAMATVDAVANKGMHPANFLDIGGGASSESVLAAFTQIMEYPEVKVIVINIFAGITRCDEVAKAIIEASKQFRNLPPLCIRLAGTNYDQAVQLLEKENIPLLPTLESCLDTAKEYAI